jgi:hypothetical protein
VVTFESRAPDLPGACTYRRGADRSRRL